VSHDDRATRPASASGQRRECPQSAEGGEEFSSGHRGTQATLPSESSQSQFVTVLSHPLFQVPSAVRSLKLNSFRIAHAGHTRDIGAFLLFIHRGTAEILHRVAP